MGKTIPVYNGKINLRIADISDKVGQWNVELYTPIIFYKYS